MRGYRCAVLTLAACCASARAGPPDPGRYDGRLCVSVGEAPANCGAAQVDVRSPRHLDVRIADLAYRLELASSQVDVVLMHGTMQIDGFFASYEWEGTTLRFFDVQKRTAYLVQLPAKARLR